MKIEYESLFYSTSLQVFHEISILNNYEGNCIKGEFPFLNDSKEEWLANST